MASTTYKFGSVALTAIKVGERHRKEFRNIAELGESLKTKGLLHPIVVTKKLQLVAGGRRLAAAKEIGWSSITVHYLEDLPPSERKLLELEENIKRANLTWQEECLAVKEFHQIKSKTKGWTLEKTADAIGIALGWVSTRITVASALEEGDQTILEAVGANAAYNILSRKQARSMDEALDGLDTDLIQEEAEEAAAAKGEPPPPPPEKERAEPNNPFQIIQTDFESWAKDYSGPKFNLLHCDFPFGIDHDKSDQGGSDTWTAYPDSWETYLGLLRVIREHKDNFLSRSCHIFFWFSMKHYFVTKEWLSIDPLFPGISPHPLIWVKSDGKGILPDPNRGPRQIYETAFFGYRGDRKIIKAVSNAIYTPQGKKSHLSEKPVAVFEHFFQMLVDENTRILDPTCGSGNALAVARLMGAKHVIGLDVDPESVKLASRNLKRSGNGKGS